VSSVKEDKIQNHYDAIAGIYDEHYDGIRGRTYHTHISGYVSETLPKGGRLLDVGCGTGLFVERYLMTGGSALGLDISRGMIERARLRCPGSEFAVGTADTLPFADNSFDAVSSLLVFSYLKNPDLMLSEAYRVLRPGGTIAICTLGKKLLTRGIPMLYHISEKVNVKHVVMKNFGENYYNEQEMTSLFSGAGFSEVRVTWCSFAHINMFDSLFSFARKVEPFVERKVPQLAYNILASGKKPDG
jgi:ubiquinone/menaquinone biosynthesis C-methylase UbiE